MDWARLRWHISRVFMRSLHLAAPGSDPGAASLSGQHADRVVPYDTGILRQLLHGRSPDATTWCCSHTGFRHEDNSHCTSGFKFGTGVLVFSSALSIAAFIGL